MENAGEQPRVRVEGSALRCPFCHADCAPEESVVCRDCLARHHATCWDEGGRCSTCGSINKLVAAQPPADAPRVLRAARSDAQRSLPVVDEAPSAKGLNALRFQSWMLIGFGLLGLIAPGISAPVSIMTLLAIILLSIFSRSRLALFTVAFNTGALVLGICAGVYAVSNYGMPPNLFLPLYSLAVAFVSWIVGTPSRD